MLKRITVAAVTAICVAGAASAEGNEQAAAPVTADTVVATVNGTDITVGDLIIVRSQLSQQYQQVPADVLLPGVLDQIVSQTLMAEELGDPSASTQRLIETQIRSIKASEYLQNVVDNAVTEDAITAAYNSQYKDAELGEEYNAAHILVETEDEAKALITELDGGKDFAELAKEKSTGPSGPNGGDLGWFSEGQMVAPFEKAVLELEAGDLSQPVQTQFGWHVILLKESRLRDAPPLEEVRSQIVSDLQQAAIQIAVEDLKSKADINEMIGEDFDASVIQDPSLLETR